MDNKLIAGMVMAAGLGMGTGNVLKKDPPLLQNQPISVECVSKDKDEVYTVDAGMYSMESRELDLRPIGKGLMDLDGERCYVRNSKGETIDRTDNPN